MGQKYAIINNEIVKEISGKYNAVASHLREELTPYIDDLEQSLMVIGSEMSKMQVAAPVLENYRRQSMALISSLRRIISNIAAYRAGEQYKAFVESSIVSLSQEVMTSLTSLEHMTSTVEAALSQYQHNLQNAAQSIRNAINDNKITNFAQDMIKRAKNVDVSPYVKNFEVPEQYNSMAEDVQDLAMSGLKTLWARPELSGVRGPVNALYQEAAWAYKFWDVEKNVEQNIHHIMTLLLEIVEAEVKEMQASVSGISSPITVLTNTEIQAEFHLPFDMANLQEIPDFQPLIADCEKFAMEVAQYLPNRTTLDNAIETVSGMFQDDEPTDITEMKKYKPSKKYKLRKGKKFSKKGKKYNKM